MLWAALLVAFLNSWLCNMVTYFEDLKGTTC